MRSRYLGPVLLIGLGLALLNLPTGSAGENADKEKIDKLIEQLGSDAFGQRRKAARELAAIGIPALEGLRKAAKSEDAEVRKQAEELLAKIEKEAASAKILGPKRLHLVCKDTPVPKAVRDLQKVSGYTIHLHDPQGKLKERTVTLDTGETTFWRAYEQLCQKAGLTEASMQDVMQAPLAPPGGPGQPAAAPAAPFIPAIPGQLILKDGKAAKRPTDDRSAVRIRAVSNQGMPKPAPGDEIYLTLEATPEPRLQCQNLQSIRIDKALDDQDQSLTQVIPQIPAGPPGFGGGAPQAVGFALPVGFGGGVGHPIAVQLKKGEKAAKSLKELKGTLTAQLLTEAQPMITAKLEKKLYKGSAGGSIKITEVKTEDKKTTIRFEFEQPPNAIPAMPQGMPGMMNAPVPAFRILPAPAAPVPPPPAKAAPPPAAPPAAAPAQPAPPPPAAQGKAAKEKEARAKEEAAAKAREEEAKAKEARDAKIKQEAIRQQQAQMVQRIQRVQIQRGQGGGAAIFVGPMNGLSVQDDKGNALPIQMGPMAGRMILGPGGNTFVMTYTITCEPGKDQAAPAQLVYLGRQRVTVEIPFVLKDVPLP